MLIPNQDDTFSINPEYVCSLGYNQPYGENYIVWAVIVHEEHNYEMGEFDNEEDAISYYKQLTKLIDNAGCVNNESKS